MKSSKLIAIIPARGGSKRIPRKNIKLFCGIPIIQYSIEVALNSNLFDNVVVSTEDEEIAEISKKSGANVPFLRSEENASDLAGTAPVINEVINEFNKTGLNYDIACCIYPTAPFVNKNILVNSYNLFNEFNCDSVFPILRYTYPIQRALKLNARNKVELIWPENYTKRSQELEPCFHDAGLFYWINTDFIKESNALYGPDSMGYELSNLHALDIDNQEDWNLAEIKYKLMHGIS